MSIDEPTFDHPRELQGRVAVVTGGAVGIGRGICVTLAQHGAAVATLDVDEDGNAETARLVEAAASPALPLTCDVGDQHQVAAAIADVVGRFGQIDVLVNNAAEWLDTSLTGGDYDAQSRAFARSLASCALGAYHCTAAALPALRQSSDANVVNVITDHVLDDHHITHLVGASGYDCAKWSLWRLTETWAVELAPLGIRVNGLCFGATDTPMLRSVNAPLAEAGMRPSDLGLAVRNVVAHGPGGPTGQRYVFGMTGNPRQDSRAEIAAIGPL